ncbi:MAG: hypothetical protein ACREIU_08245, partial [Planctomycetota bacterium]
STLPDANGRGASLADYRRSAVGIGKDGRVRDALRGSPKLSVPHRGAVPARVGGGRPLASAPG